jgi:valyl-tRNA synthetase
MALNKKYESRKVENSLIADWRAHQVNNFNPDGSGDIFSIDTPPPTVSGFLHLGHVYSYSHTDFIARFRRMQGWRVFYPMGFDDNGLPTERFVEKIRGIKPMDISREAYIELCSQISEKAEEEYRNLWQRLGLSIDWRYSYSSIDENSRRIAQWSFLRLYQKNDAYYRQAPGIWCPECQASFAQADLNDVERESEYVVLKFFAEGKTLPVATTRPELLAACVAIFVHPEDSRYAGWIGKQVQVPIYNFSVPVLVDQKADPTKGTGVVMCCTFGDAADISWWRAYNLNFIELISKDGNLLEPAGPIQGMTISLGRERIKEILAENNFIIDRQPTSQTIRVHERCDTPVEYRMLPQWFIRVLDHKDKLLDLGQQLNWYPSYMKARYMSWVENLNWDWCISRQRYFGVPIPVWFCLDCGSIHTADVSDLPIDPIEALPPGQCTSCGSRNFRPERDVMDTWATSSMSPQIAGQFFTNPSLYEQVFPYSLRPQAHDIIRTWVFYTIVKSYLHFGRLPWRDIAISGWGIAGEGMGKISKSRGGGPVPPLQMIEQYSADALRYWAASTGPGKDAVINEEKIQSGQKLVNKLWNISRFASRFLDNEAMKLELDQILLSPADRWILARLQSVIQITTDLLMAYDYAAAKNEIEAFFWHDLADNYLEMCKQRLYDLEQETRCGAIFTLREVLFSVLQLFSPFLPFVADQIYLGLFSSSKKDHSIHQSQWPQQQPVFMFREDEEFGSTLITIAGAVRRFKSENQLPLGTVINQLQLATVNKELIHQLNNAMADLKSITRAAYLEVDTTLDPELVVIHQDDDFILGVRLDANSSP